LRKQSLTGGTPMARGRMINKDVAHSVKLADLESDCHRMLYMMTIPHLDRDGLVLGEPRRLRSVICPLLEQHSVADVARAVADWCRVALAVAYTDGNGAMVIHLRGFQGSQVGMRYDREVASEFGPPPVVAQLPAWIRRHLPEAAGSTPLAASFYAGTRDRCGNELHPEAAGSAPATAAQEKGSEGKGREGKGPRQPPADVELGPEAAVLLAHLATFPELTDQTNPSMADELAGMMIASGKRMPQLKEAIAACAKRIKLDEASGDVITRNIRTRMLTGYARNAGKFPRDGGPDDDGGKPTATRPEILPAPGPKRAAQLAAREAARRGKAKASA